GSPCSLAWSEPSVVADLTGFEPATSALTGRRALLAAPQVRGNERPCSPIGKEPPVEQPFTLAGPGSSPPPGTRSGGPYEVAARRAFTPASKAGYLLGSIAPASVDAQSRSVVSSASSCLALMAETSAKGSGQPKNFACPSPSLVR